MADSRRVKLPVPAAPGPMPAAGGHRGAQDGTQTIQRVFSLLRVVAGEGGQGLRLSEIAVRANLHLATTRRMLLGLVQERAVVYDPYCRVYHIGHDFLQQEDETQDQRVRKHFRAVTQRVADLSQDTVFLATRHGLDALYIDIAPGRYPGESLPLAVGERRPLGIGAASLVLLAALPRREQGRAIDANESRYPRYNRATADEVRASLRAYRREGFAYAVDAVVTGLSGVGVPLYDDQGEVVAAISALTTNERMTPDHQHRVARWMRTEAAKAGELITHPPRGPRLG